MYIKINAYSSLLIWNKLHTYLVQVIAYVHVIAEDCVADSSAIFHCLRAATVKTRARTQLQGLHLLSNPTCNARVQHTRYD